MACWNKILYAGQPKRRRRASGKTDSGSTTHSQHGLRKPRCTAMPSCPLSPNVMLGLKNAPRRRQLRNARCCSYDAIPHRHHRQHTPQHTPLGTNATRRLSQPRRMAAAGMSAGAGAKWPAQLWTCLLTLSQNGSKPNFRALDLAARAAAAPHLCHGLPRWAQPLEFVVTPRALTSFLGVKHRLPSSVMSPSPPCVAMTSSESSLNHRPRSAAVRRKARQRACNIADEMRCAHMGLGARAGHHRRAGKPPSSGE